MYLYMHITPNKKRYVGITKQLPEQRWRNGEGYKRNTYFYRAIQKYGWDNIKHLILARGLTEDEANELEEKIIDAMDLTNPENGYNLHSGGRHHKVTDATREKTSMALKGMFSGEKNPFYGRHHTEETLKKMKRPVQQYSMSGEYIKTFDGLTEAAKEFGLDPSQLAKTCKKDKLSYGGYQWKYADSDKEIKAYKRTSHNARRVIMCNMDGEPLRVFDSLSEAGKRFSKNAGKCIGQCCCGNQKTAYGYKWKYE